MKLKHIIENIKKEKQFESNIWLPGFSQNVFGYDGFDSNNFNDEHHEQERLKSYYYKMWYCTDSYVGEKVYFLDDKPVAISSQYGRKSEEDVELLSLEAYNSVKEYVKTFIEEEVKTIETLDLEQEIPDTYNLSFYDELFDFHKKDAYYNGIKVEVIEPSKENTYVKELVVIKYSDGKTETIDVKLLDFKLNVN